MSTTTTPATSDDAKALWTRYAPRYDLPVDAHGQTFTSRGTSYKIIGIAPNRPKFPVDVVRTRDNTPFKFKVDGVKKALGLATTTAAPAPTPTGGLIGKIVTFRGTTYKVTEYVPSRFKYPYTVARQPDGKLFKFPASLVEGTGSASAPTFTVGQPVTYTAKFWPDFKDKTYTGVVTLVKRDGACEVYGEGLARGFKDFAASDITPAPKRTDAEIVNMALGVYGNLSPENLTCDGERARSEVNRLATIYNRALRALFTEAGRTITESEAYASARKGA